MKKTCAVCKNLIDLNEEGISIKSVEFPGMYYCMCPECGNVNVDCSSNATLIALDQVVSENIHKDADKSIIKHLNTEVGLDNFLEMLYESTNKALESLLKEGNKENEKNNPSNPIKVVKISAEPSKKIAKEAKKDESKKSIRKSTIKENEDNKIKHVAYAKGKMIKEFSEDIDMNSIFNELMDTYGIDAIKNEDVIVYEMKPIKPKFKEKLVYELDI